MESMPDIVDRIAKTEPDRVWVNSPASTTNPKETIWHDITFQQLSNAVNIMAYWIDQHIGQPANKDEREPLAYVGLNDVRYPIIILAALKTGYTALLASPRNSVDGHLSLMEATGCKKLVFSSELKSQAHALTQKNPELIIIQAPELDPLLQDEALTPPYPSDGRTLMKANETVMILHSSGTTGLPKPIPTKAGVFGVVQKIMSQSCAEGRRYMHRELYGTKLLVAVVPFFHGFGINLLARSIYHQGPLVLLPPTRPPSADLVLLAMEKTQPTAVACAPSILEDICGVPGGIEALSKLELINCGGAPLAHSCGDRLSKVTMLVNGLGSTEIYFAASYIPEDPSDWEYFGWSAKAGIDMEVTEDPNLSEMVIKRGVDMDHQFVFHNFPDLDEWRTNDLFERHPSKPALWKYVGRHDDVLVLSNGEKINPVHFEKVMEGHPRVKGALMVGSGQFQAGLIVEPRRDAGDALDTNAVVREIWATVSEANNRYPAHARVWRSMIRLANPEKPFVRTPKQSIMRQTTYQLYKDEIDGLYCTAIILDEGKRVQKEPSVSSAKDTIRSAVLSVLGEGQNLVDHTDLFSVGMDSLQVVELSQILRKALPQGGAAACSPKTVYENPSINALAIVLSEPTQSCSHRTESREEAMSAMIHKYTNSIPWVFRSTRQGRVVMLTGSTGSLGTHLLHQLLRMTDVSHVHCLNRAADSAERQRCLFVAGGMGLLQDHFSRVTFHTTDLSQERFGLVPETYAALLRQTDVVIHNAWPVNFNKTLADFEGAILGTRRCADFAAAARRDVHVVFVSSVASVLNYAAVRAPDTSHSGWESVPEGQVRADGNAAGMTVVPEEFDRDNSLPAKQGYGESKHVAECILDEAARRAGIRVSILRAGQLAGPQQGDSVWNRHEWLPSLIATSRALGKIPGTLGPGQSDVDWIPVDVAAQVMLDIVFSPRSGGTHGLAAAECFNIVNPKTVNWGQLAKTVQEFYGGRGSTIDVVPLGEWLDGLLAVDAMAEKKAVQRYPALRLLDFFRGLQEAKVRCSFSTRRALECSPVLVRLTPIDDGLMRKWLSGWDF